MVCMKKTEAIRLTNKKLNKLLFDTAKSAEAVNLVYVNSSDPGITRIKADKGFVYKRNNKIVRDEDTLLRIKRLVIPPAWENVWICNSANGHLQVTGTDKMGRKQYKYHPLWNTLRNHTKFNHLSDFGKTLPAIRQRLQKDLSQKGLPLTKVLATIVSLMQLTCIRIGNSMYEKLYGSFGLTTLKDQHVKINGSELKFSFKGKKGVYHDISMKSKKLANIVKQCRDIPGKELFQYYDGNGDRKSVDSGMVNNYIKEISGGNYTAKDFRTWEGTLQALEVFKNMPPPATITESKRKIVEALDIVAKKLGNTRTVCKKYYVHPIVIDLYTTSTLIKFIGEQPVEPKINALNSDEKILLKILETSKTTVIAA